MTELDLSLELRSAGPGLWHGVASPLYDGPNGMWGGWTTAVMLKAVLDDPTAAGSPVSLTINFCGQLPAGSPIALRTRRVNNGRSIAHWCCDLAIKDTAELAATAVVVLANRRESDRFVEARMPTVAAPEGLPIYPLPPRPVFTRLEQRPANGGDVFNRTSTGSTIWMRELSGASLDYIRLAALCDFGPPVVFYVSKEPRPSATMTMNAYFHATEAEIAEVGADFVLSERIATRIESSISGSRSNLWSRAGKLLATSEQLCWFR